MSTQDVFGFDVIDMPPDLATVVLLGDLGAASDYAKAIKAKDVPYRCPACLNNGPRHPNEKRSVFVCKTCAGRGSVYVMLPF